MQRIDFTVKRVKKIIKRWEGTLEIQKKAGNEKLYKSAMKEQELEIKALKTIVNCANQAQSEIKKLLLTEGEIRNIIWHNTGWFGFEVTEEDRKFCDRLAKALTQAQLNKLGGECEKISNYFG